LFDTLLEAILIGFWILAFYSRNEIPQKHLILFASISLITIIFYVFKVKYTTFIHPILILLYLILFPLVSTPQLVIDNRTIPWNILLLCLGILILTISKWNSKIIIVPNNQLTKSLFISGAGLLAIGVLLYFVLSENYELVPEILISLVKNLMIIFIVGFFSYYAILNKKQYLRIAIYSLGVSTLLIFI
jgi:hypothetical protein